jgi:RND family efflux transporter MFP subunit
MSPKNRALISALPLLLLCACKDDALPPIPTRPLLTMTIAPITTEVFGPFASTVEARYQTQLGFQTSGRMVTRDVYVGDLVHRGQRLAALDPALATFALTRAKADVEDAKAQLLNNQGVEARQRVLASGGNVAQATLDTAVASLATAKARLDQSQASLHTAEDQMGYTELHANFDGVVTAWTAEVGQFVSNGNAVVTIARPDIRDAVVDIPDDLIGNVHSGAVFTASLLAAPAITAQAIVREIGPSADSATRSHRIRLTLQDPSNAFRIGTTITIAEEHPVPPRIIVPDTAIVDRNGKHFVWLLEQDKARVEQREVSIARKDDSNVLVKTGLSAGDKIIIAGVHSLNDGLRVKSDEGIFTVSAKAQGTYSQGMHL